MGIVQHPNLPKVSRTVPDADEPRWVAQGWKPLLNAEQKARLTELDNDIRDSVESHRRHPAGD